jgi:hypothetical protein
MVAVVGFLALLLEVRFQLSSSLVTEFLEGRWCSKCVFLLAELPLRTAVKACSASAYTPYRRYTTGVREYILYFRRVTQGYIPLVGGTMTMSNPSTRSMTVLKS